MGVDAVRELLAKNKAISDFMAELRVPAFWSRLVRRGSQSRCTGAPDEGHRHES